MAMTTLSQTDYIAICKLARMMFHDPESLVRIKLSYIRLLSCIEDRFQHPAQEVSTV